MYRVIVRIMSLVVLFWIGIGNSAWLTVAAVPANRQLTQSELLDRLVGSWVFESSSMGNGFIGSTHSGEKTPLTVIKRSGDNAMFDVSMQTGQESYGAPINEDFHFTLEKITETEYALTVESQSWLNLKQLKLSLADGVLQGKTTIPFNKGTAPLEVTIQTDPSGGHTWKLSLLRSNGKQQRFFELKFKPASSVQGNAVI
jgi:hypothetical protein